MSVAWTGKYVSVTTALSVSGTFVVSPEGEKSPGRGDTRHVLPGNNNRRETEEKKRKERRGGGGGKKK